MCIEGGGTLSLKKDKIEHVRNRVECARYYIMCKEVSFMTTLEDSIDTSIFDESETRIIIRGDVLTTEYIPKRLIGRDEQIKEVAGLMRQLFRHGFPNNGLIFGVSGSGKTVVSKFVLRSLMAKLKQNSIGINVDWIYIHCKKVYTQNSILYTLIKYLDPTTKVKKTGYSMDYYYDSLFHLMNTKNTALIVILDEIDFLRSEDVLYNFSRAVANEELQDGRFIRVIGLSNSSKYEARLDNRIISSMGAEKINFPAYNTDDLFHILKDRVDLAFAPGSIDEDTIIKCAADTAQFSGDVRKALRVLHTAAIIAENEKSNVISIDHIQIAENKVQKDQIIESVVKLPIHHKIVLLSIVKLMTNNKSVTTGSVTAMYDALCKQIAREPIHRTGVSRCIGSLEMQSFVNTILVNKGANGGITRYISIPTEDISQLKLGIYADDELEELRECFPMINGGE